MQNGTHDFPPLWNAKENPLEASMNKKRIGTRTIALSQPPSVLSCAAVGGRHEGAGPLGAYFDYLDEDSFFGERPGKRRSPPCRKRPCSWPWTRRG